MGDVIAFRSRSKPPFNPPPQAVKAALLAEKFLNRRDELREEVAREAEKVSNRPANVTLLRIPDSVQKPWLRARRYQAMADMLLEYAYALAELPPTGEA